MKRGIIVKWTAGSLVMLALAIAPFQTAWAQYPTKPITMIVGMAAGGSTDVTIRTLSEAASKILGQPIVVTNKPGGAGAVALVLLKNEKPDGYTIGNISISGLLSQHMRKVPYDVTKDFTTIMRYGTYIHGIVVQADSPWKTMVELVEYAKANPGKLKYSTSGVGSLYHLVMEALALQQGIKWVHVPFTGGHTATTALLGGHVDVEACDTAWKPYVDSGRLRLLSTYMPERLAKYPNVPTWIELGYRISASSFLGIAGPKGLPLPIVEKLHGAFKQSLGNPEFKKALENFDMPLVYRNPEGLAKDIQDMSDDWGKLISQLGLKQE